MRITSGLVGTLVLLVVAAACGGSSASTSSSSNSKLLGIVEITATDVTTDEVAAAISKNASAAGWSIITADAQGSVDKANAAMVNFVSRKVTAIVVTVFASNSLLQGLNAAKAANIPVVSYAGGLAPGIAASLDGNGGTPVSQRLLSDLNNAGSVLDFTYHPGLPCLEREQSFTQAVGSNSNIHVTRHEIDVQNATQDAATTTTAWLATKPTPPLAIYGCYDDPSIGAISALKQAHLQPGAVKVYGFNATPDAQALIKAGWMTASMWFDQPSGGTTVWQLVQQVVAAGPSWKQTSSDIPNQLIDASNLAAWQAAHPGGI